MNILKKDFAPLFFFSLKAYLNKKLFNQLCVSQVSNRKAVHLFKQYHSSCFWLYIKVCIHGYSLSNMTDGLIHLL